MSPEIRPGDEGTGQRNPCTIFEGNTLTGLNYSEESLPAIDRRTGW
jgi:hypothetical protein